MIQLSEINSVLDLVRSVAGNIKNAELNRAILELHGTVFKLYGEYGNEREARERAESKVRELEAKALALGELDLKDGMLCKKGTDQNQRFCQRCHEVEKHLVALKTIAPNEVYRCPNCKETFDTLEYTCRLIAESGSEV